ncbi:MAG: hypothetical protein JW703_02580, partial [Candidatus Diapherotrites archaeon]|nr:hypothetical protein [Candidatus Diapherotrites archaeon]
SQVTVSIEPVQQKEIYSFEEKEFRITVFNNEPIEVNGFELKVSSENGLKIIENGREKDFREFPPMSLLPQSKIEKIVSFKSNENSDKEFTIFLDYGIGKKEFQTTTKFTVKKNEITFNPRIEAVNSKEEEKNNILFDLENNSIESIRKVKIELKENEFIEVKTKAIEFDEFISGQKLINAPIDFIIIKEVKKPMNLMIELTYTDALGEHLIKKEIEFIPAENDLLFTAVIALLLIGILLFIYLQSKPKKEIPVKAKKEKNLEEQKQELMN